MLVQRSTGSLCETVVTTNKEHARVGDCSSSILSPKESAQSSEPLKIRSIQQLNEVSAAWVSFLSRMLIERIFFQNTIVPQEALLYLANDLMRTLVPQQTETMSVSKELVIMWKQARGQPLTAEEEAYDKSDKEIDVVGEILNGVSYSTTALIGQNLFSSLRSAVTKGFWNHVPAIVGYSGVALLGSRGVAYAVNELLQQTSYTKEQKEWMRPWLNMVGRLALGFVPKVHATDAGVHYQYPSTEGSTQTFSKGQVATVQGDSLRIEKTGTLETSEGEFEGVYAADFKLRQVYELTEERIRIQVVDQNGIPVPVEFKRVDRETGPEIEVVCDDQQIAAYWTRILHPKEAAPQIDPTNGLSCPMSLALGAVGTLTAHNVLPLALGAMSCVRKVHAVTTGDVVKTPENTGVANFDQKKLSTFIRETINFVQAKARLKYLEELEEAGALTGKDKREYDQLSVELYKKEDRNTVEIKRDDHAQFYTVELKENPARVLTDRFSQVSSDIAILQNDNTLDVINKIKTPYTLHSTLEQVNNVMGFDFGRGLEESYKIHLMLTAAAGRLYYRTHDIYPTLLSLATDSASLFNYQKNLNRRCQAKFAGHIDHAQKRLKKMATLIESNRGLATENRVLKEPSSFDSINDQIKRDAEGVANLCEEMDTQLAEYEGKVDIVEVTIKQGILTITNESQEVGKLIKKIEELNQAKTNLISLSKEVADSEKDWREKNGEKIGSRKIEKREFHVLFWRIAQWEEIHQEDFGSTDAWNRYIALRDQFQKTSSLIANAELNLAGELANHIPKSTGDAKENLDKASRALAQAIAGVDSLKKQVRSKREMLRDQQTLIKEKLQAPTSEGSKAKHPVLVNTLEDAVNFIEDLGARIIGLRYMQRFMDYQNVALVEVERQQDSLRMLMAKEVGKGIFDGGVIEQEYDRVAGGNIAKNPFDIMKLIASSPSADQKSSEKNQAPKGKEEL